MMNTPIEQLAYAILNLTYSEMTEVGADLSSQDVNETGTARLMDKLDECDIRDILATWALAKTNPPIVLNTEEKRP